MISNRVLLLLVTVAVTPLHPANASLTQLRSLQVSFFVFGHSPAQATFCFRVMFRVCSELKVVLTTASVGGTHCTVCSPLSPHGMRDRPSRPTRTGIRPRASDMRACAASWAILEGGGFRISGLSCPNGVHAGAPRTGARPPPAHAGTSW
jgi:hypothetical protein